MTAEFELLLHLMGAASRGTPAAAPANPVDWNRVFHLAEQQQILPLICHGACALHPCPDVLPMVLAGCARTGSVIALLEEMNAAGLPCCVVKGFAAGIPYAAPEYRISGDTDIVIPPELEEQICAFLACRGFSIRPHWEHGHHTVARHPKMGILELHVRLYDELVEDIWFSGQKADTLIQEPKRKITTPDGTYWTLGPTDHAIYMALHMVKHFILSGNSLRMMMDVALSLSGQQDHVDMNRFWDTMDQLHYGDLLRNILWCMIQFCGFRPEEFSGIGSPDESCIRMLLDDLEQGGWLGKKDSETRSASWHEYNRQVMMKTKSSGQYALYMLNWGHSFRLGTLFPDKKRLVRDYPLLLKYPVLLPFIWIHRILFRGLPLIFSGAWFKPIRRKEDPMGNESLARVNLFRCLHMIE